MTRLLATLILALTALISIPAAAQPETDRFRETLQIGRGAVLNAQWHSSGDMILVDTVRGAWLYSNTLADIAHLPDARLARFSPDGQLIAGIDRADQLTLWSSETFFQTASLVGSTTYLIALEWSPDGAQIATLERTGRILVWDMAGRRMQFEARLNGANQIAWSKGGSYLAAMNQDTGAVSVWEAFGALTLMLKPSIYSSIYTASVLWRNDIELLRWIGEENAVVDVWDVKTRERIAQPHAGAASQLAYSPDGTALAVASYGSHIQYVDTGTLIAPLPEGSQTASVTAWSPDGKQVAFGTWSPDTTVMSIVFVVDALTGEILHVLNQYYNSVKGIYWSIDNQGLLIVDGANRLSLVALSNSVPYRGYSIVHMDIGTTAAWESEGNKIAVADTFWGLRIWDAKTGVAFAPTMNIGQPASMIVWQPSGTFIAIKSGDWWWQSTDQNVYIWDVANPQLDANPVMIIPNVDFVAGIAWSPDGELLAIAERSRFVRFWSPSTPGVIQAIDL